ncbi:MAG: hypothetical protein OEZ24_02900 [Candidatus Bathyarchaeota archaeon]|nr:hypothetical protein [Candidatus Bathyarchaeota archaeon]
MEVEKIEKTIRKVQQDSFTVLEFISVFKELHPEDWKRLAKLPKSLGEKRRYTVTRYLSNRLDLYSSKADSLLMPFTRYSEGKFKDYRKTTEKKRKFFGSPWIAIFKKKEGRGLENNSPFKG